MSWNCWAFVSWGLRWVEVLVCGRGLRWFEWHRGATWAVWWWLVCIQWLIEEDENHRWCLIDYVNWLYVAFAPHIIDYGFCFSFQFHLALRFVCVCWCLYTSVGCSEVAEGVGVGDLGVGLLFRLVWCWVRFLMYFFFGLYEHMVLDECRKAIVFWFLFYCRQCSFEYTLGGWWAVATRDWRWW